MIISVARTHFAKLRRDSPGVILSFIVPIGFFSVFAMVFSGREQIQRTSIALFDADGTESSRRYSAALRLDPSVTIVPVGASGEGVATLAATEAAVQSGRVPAAVIFPKEFGRKVASGARGADRASVVFLIDAATNPLAMTILTSVLGRIAASQGELQPSSLADATPFLIEPRNVMASKTQNPWAAIPAAGLGVMFLLFTAASAGGTLIDEAENGTLERILCTRVGMTELLLGKMVYLVALATLQMSIMFIWGAVFFDLPLRGHIAGFFVMTIVTACVAGTFGLLLGAVCRTHTQLAAISNLTVLMMSAVGGSLFPRSLMPPFMQALGWATPNAWALDGFLKIFWRNENVWRLWPNVLILGSGAVILFAVARRFAVRWEAA